jgi:hypothetical protein
VSRLTALLLIVALAAGAPAAPGSKGGDTPLYFPTTVGDTAVYETTLGKLRYEHTHRVTKAAKECDGVRVTVEDKEFGRPPQEYEKVVSAAGLRHTRTFGQELDPPAPDLRLPAKAGDRWAWEAAGGTTRYTVVGEEEVEVPAGKFKAVRVKKERTDGKSRSEVWWAPGVGLVKQVFDVGDNTQQVQVLKSFTPAEKK